MLPTVSFQSYFGFCCWHSTILKINLYQKFVSVTLNRSEQNIKYKFISTLHVQMKFISLKLHDRRCALIYFRKSNGYLCQSSCSISISVQCVRENNCKKCKKRKTGLKSYLSNRKQYVYLNGVSSDIKEISCGVPQGSVLGPLLFLLYINDLPNISKILDFYLFADDTSIYYESESLDKLEKKVNKELRKLQMWLNVNRLSLNISKTNFVVFHPFNKPLKHQITLKIQKKAISQKNHIKYLGSNNRLNINLEATNQKHFF